MAPSHKLGDNSFTIKRTCASNCLHLVLTSTVVVMSVIKIIIGAEFVHACPLEPILPVYVVISGCLPVFLSALRDPYDRGGGAKYDNSSYTFMMGVSVLGILLNTAWLVAGSAWVYNTWNGVEIRASVCQTQSSNTTYLSQGQGQFNTSAISSTSTGTRINMTTYTTPQYNISISHQQENDTLLNISRANDTFAISKNRTDSSASRVNVTNATIAQNISGNSDQMDIFTTSKYRSNKSPPCVNVTSVIAQNTSENNDHLDNVDISTCKSCDRTLLMFASICVVVDWTCLAVGALYMSYRCCKALLWVKVEFRKIVNTSR